MNPTLKETLRSGLRGMPENPPPLPRVATPGFVFTPCDPHCVNPSHTRILACLLGPTVCTPIHMTWRALPLKVYQIKASTVTYGTP